MNLFKKSDEPVFSKNLEQIDSIQSSQKPSSKKPLLIAVVIIVICLLLVAGSLTALFWLHHTNTTDDAVREPSQTTVRSDIPDSALVNPQNGHSYFVYTDSVSWIDAKTACESLGGHLQLFPMHKNRHLSNSFHKLALNAQISGLAVTTTEIGTSGNGSMERHSPIQTGIPGTMAKQNSANRTTTPEMNGIFVLESPIKPMKLGSNMLDAGMILQTELAMRTIMFR